MPANLVTPQTPEELAEALGGLAANKQTITLGGHFSKNRMGGPLLASDAVVSTSAMTRVLSYEPRDLTISVEAGLPWAEFTNLLAANRQMVPLDPPFADLATVGGVVAANTSGPRRRLYGTARDLVIGMKFATLQGKLVQSGGMVVKNVAGLDMGKLMIGSFGTLAAIAVLNFKLQPEPYVQRHFLLTFDSCDLAAQAVRGVLQSVLQPASIDLLNPAAAQRIGLDGWIVSLQAGGNAAVIERYEKDLRHYGAVRVAASQLQEFIPSFLNAHPQGAVARFPVLLARVAELAARFREPVVARAGSGVCYVHFDNVTTAAEAVRTEGKAIIEFAPESQKQAVDLWPAPGGDLELMRRVKQMLDPHNLQNRGRLYRHI